MKVWRAVIVNMMKCRLCFEGDQKRAFVVVFQSMAAFLFASLLSLRKMERKGNKQIFVIGYMLNWFQRAICDMVSTLLNLKCFRLWQTKYLWHFFQSNFGRLIMLIVFWILKPCNEWNSRPSQNMYMSSSTYTTIFIHFLRSCVHHNWTRKTGLSHTSFS